MQNISTEHSCNYLQKKKKHIQTNRKLFNEHVNVFFNDILRMIYDG